MVVYKVDCIYGMCWCKGIFSTREKAEKYMQKLKSRYQGLYDITEIKVDEEV